MAKDAEITRVEEVRGADGSTAYRIHGGREGQGGDWFHVSKETMHNLEKEGRQSQQETLKRLMQSTLDGRGERLE